MQGKTLILICLLIFSGCAVLRRDVKTGVDDLSSKSVNLGKLRSLNLSNSGFFISKASLEITGRDVDEKAVCTIKFNPAGEYLISIRSRTGIEGGRMFISPDTVLVNDRINRLLYFGSSLKLSEKYGIEYLLIPLIFGDYITGMPGDSTDQECVDGRVRIRSSIEGSIVTYIIDCKEDKVINTETGAVGSMKLIFRNFRNKGQIKYPEIIEAENLQKGLKLKLKIENLVYPWEGIIEFVPGSNYERVPLI